MFATIIMAVMAIIVILCFITAIFGPSDMKGGAFAGGIVVGLLGTLMLVFNTVHIVNDGHVGVTKAFGEYGEETLDPGINFVAPWVNVHEESTQIKEFTFASNDAGQREENAIGPALTSQAEGGGNLTYDMTVQYSLRADEADNVLVDIGSDWESVILYPAARSCGRDATGELSVEEAFTSGRGDIATNNIECLQGKVEPYVTIQDVLVRDVDPGAQVKQAIDDKQKADQAVQQAIIDIGKKEAEAQQLAVEAFGISNAEQIIACGGTESTIESAVTGEEITIILPNDECEDQFSEEYLQWLYINQLSEIDGVVILPPEFDGELFIQTPQPSN